MINAAPPAKTPWRWVVYILAAVALLVDLIWLLEGTMAPMGYGGRSAAQIVGFVVIVVILPMVLGAYLAVRASVAAKQGQLRTSVICLLAALTLLPAVWLLDVFVVRL